MYWPYCVVDDDIVRHNEHIIATITSVEIVSGRDGEREMKSADSEATINHVGTMGKKPIRKCVVLSSFLASEKQTEDVGAVETLSDV